MKVMILPSAAPARLMKLERPFFKTLVFACHRPLANQEDLDVFYPW